MKDKVIEPSRYPLVCMDCANHLIMEDRLLVKCEEYKHLKRIEDKINNLIKHYESYLNSSRTLDESLHRAVAFNRLELLKSLER